MLKSVRASGENAGCKLLQVSKSVDVGKIHLLLPHKANATTTVPVNFTFTYPAHTSPERPKPLILLLNGGPTSYLDAIIPIFRGSESGKFRREGHDYYRRTTCSWLRRGFRGKLLV